MDIERCHDDGEDWKLKLRHRGQIIFVAVSREEVTNLVDGENITEVTVLDALRKHHDALERAVDAAVLEEEKPAEFSSLRVIHNWE